MKQILTNLKVLLTLMLLCGVSSVWAENSTDTWVFVKQAFMATLNGSSTEYQWTASNGSETVASASGYADAKGIQTTLAKLVLTCPNTYKNVSSVVVSYSTNDKSTAKISVKAGTATSEQQQVEKGKTNVDLTFDFSAEEDNQNIVITCDKNGTAGSLYIKTVKVVYGGTPTPTPQLQSIAISGTPSKLTYTEGESFDPAGLTVTGTYDIGDPQDLTSDVTWSFDPETLSLGTTSVDVTATVGTCTSDAFTVTGITVTEKPKAGKFAQYAGELVDGDYLVTFDNKAMKALIASDRLQYDAVSPTAGVISDPDLNLVWHIEADGDYFTIYNAATGMYAASTGAKNKAALSNEVGDNALWSVTGSETFEFVNKANKANGVNANLRENGEYGFACYSTSTGGALTLYKKSVDGEIAKPSFTPTESSFVGSVNVTLAAAEGLDIYYTLDGTTPTTSSTKYTAPIKLTATTTIKAIASNGTKSSEVAEKTYTGVAYTTCAEAAALAKDEIAYLNPVTVVYVAEDKGYIYVKDATGVALIYDFDLDDVLVAGDVVEGLIAKSAPYNGLPELKPTVKAADLTITAGTAPEPTFMEIAPVAADVNKYVAFENVTVAAGEFTTGSATNLDMTIGSETVVLRNAFKDTYKFIADKKYTIIGAVAIYNDVVQVYFISAQPTPQNYDLTMSSSGYATLYLDYPATIPTGFKAYRAEAIGGTKIKLEEIEGSVPANFGVLVKGAANETATFEGFYLPEGMIGGVHNLFRGVVEDTYVDDVKENTIWVLNAAESTDANPKFSQYTGSTLNANKAYLDIEAPAGANLTFVFGDATGIDTVETVKAATTRVNLAGQVVGKDYKGVVIENGKKFLNK